MKRLTIVCLLSIAIYCPLYTADKSSSLEDHGFDQSSGPNIEIKIRRIPTIDAITQNKLEKAIRSLDIAMVRRIVTEKNFTQQEYIRYINLAEEMVRNRDIWLRKIYGPQDDRYDDVTTPLPYGIPSEGQLMVECLGGILGTYVSGFYFFFHLLDEKVPNIRKATAFAVMAMGILLFKKFLHDRDKVATAWYQHKELLRKKYDDAITIKQLMYTATIVDA